MGVSVASRVCQCHLAGPRLGYGQMLVHLVPLPHWHWHCGASLSANSSDEPNQLFRIIEYFGVEGTFKGCLGPAMSRDIFNCIGLLKALSNFALNVSRNGAARSSPYSLCQCFTILIINCCFLKSSVNLPSFSLEPLFHVLLHQALLNPAGLYPSCPTCAKPFHKLTYAIRDSVGVFLDDCSSIFISYIRLPFFFSTRRPSEGSFAFFFLTLIP